MSVNALLSGKFQSDFEEYFTYHLPARKTYTTYVLDYPITANLPWGERIAEKTNEYEKNLNMNEE